MSFTIDDQQRHHILTNTRTLFAPRNTIPPDFDIIIGACQNGKFASVIAYNQTNSNPRGKIQVVYRVDAAGQAEAMNESDKEVQDKVNEAFNFATAGAAWDTARIAGWFHRCRDEVGGLKFLLMGWIDGY